MKLLIRIALLLTAIVLVFFIHKSINTPIQFKKDAKKREKVVIERLKDIRKAQLAYKEANGAYAETFEKLIDFLNNGKLPIIVKIGSDEDTLAMRSGDPRKWRRDTLYVPAKDSLFKNNVKIIDSLKYIPFSQGETFRMQAGEIETNAKVKVKVFEVFAPQASYLKGLNEEFISKDPEKGLRVGSMTEASTSGNWE